jgi:hypothetical protein
MPKKEYKTGPKPPSRMFLNSLQNGHGSPDMECGWCGRIHLCPTAQSRRSDEDFGQEWEEACLRQHEENPEGVVLHWDYDFVQGHMFNSINFVEECPCNGLARYETFIWAERDSIREFLKKRIDLEYEYAQQEKTKNKLAGIDAKDDKTEEFWRGY